MLAWCLTLSIAWIGLACCFAQNADLVSTSSPAPVEIESQAGGASTNSAAALPLRGILAKNLAVLVQRTWADTAAFGGKVIAAGFLWTFGLGILGAGLGLITWLFLRKKEAFHLPFSWYAYFRWIWVVVFVGCFGVGFAYAGLFLGTGRALNHGIAKDRVVERLVGNIYVAIALDSAKYELTGEESANQIQATLQRSEATAAVVSGRLGEIIKRSCQTEFAKGKLSPWTLRLLQRVSDSSIGNLALDRMSGDVDPAIVIGCLYALSSGEEANPAFVKDNPHARPALALISGFVGRIRKEASSFVNGLVFPQACLGIGGGISIPLFLTVFACMGRRTLARKSPSPPPLVPQE
jgi:hypothetical protein